MAIQQKARRDLQLRGEIARRMRAARDRAGMSLKDAADRFGLSTNSISAWETGGSFPWVENLIQAADIYGVSVDWLLGRHGDMNDPDAALLMDALRIADRGLDREALLAIARSVTQRGVPAA